MSFYKVDDLVSAILALSYTDMMSVSKQLAVLRYRYIDFGGDHDFADLLTSWAKEFRATSEVEKK